MLTVHSIRLKNFLAYTDQQIQLPAQGVILISGRSGAGKTALAEGLALALGGLKAGRGAGAELRRQGSGEDEEAFVEATFICLERTITVHRDLNGKNTWLNDSQAGRIRGAKNVDSHLQGLLGGLDLITYRNAFYSPQGELDALVRQAPAARRRQLRRLLHLNLLDQVQADISGQQKEAAGQLAALTEQLHDQDPDALKEQLTQISVSVDEASRQSAALERDLQESETQGRQLRERHQSLQEQQKAHQRSQAAAARHHAELERLAGQAQLLEEQLQENPSADEPANEENLRHQLRELEGQQREHLRAARLVAQLAEHKALRRHLRRRYRSALRLLGEESELAQLAGSSVEQGRCVLCHGPANPRLSQIAKAACDHQQAKQARELVERYQLMVTQTGPMAEKARQAAGPPDRSRQIRKMQIQLDRARENRNRTAQTKSWSAQLASTHAQMAQMRQNAPKTSPEPAPGELESSETALQGALNQHGQLREAAAAHAERLSSLKREHQAAKDAFQRARQLQEKTAQASRQAKSLHELHGLLDQFRRHIITRLRPALAQLATRHLAGLSDGRLTDVEFTDEWDLQVTCDGQIRNASLLSGGEQARLALALRLALCELLGSGAGEPPGFMVLDEALSSQDHEHRQAILGGLAYARSQLPQILLISHEEALQSSELIDAAIKVEETPAGRRTLKLAA